MFEKPVIATFFLSMCTGQHHCQHAGEVGRIISTMETAEERADDQFVYC